MSRIGLIVVFVLSSFAMHAQIDTSSTFDYSNKRTFSIGGIKIEGATSRDRNAIKSIAGLRAGKEITIPGDDIPKAIKALLNFEII